MNNFDSLDNKTKQLLNQLSEEYRDLLIRKIIEDNNYSDLDSISLRDIIDEDSHMKQIMLRNKLERKKERLFRTMLSAGLIYSLIGISYYVYTNVKFSYNSSERIALIFTLFGALIAVSSFAFKTIPADLFLMRKKGREKAPKFNERFAIIEKWNEIEMLSYKLSKIDSNGSHLIPLSNVIDDLAKRALITEEDKRIIRKILEVRNSLVHYSENNFSKLNFEESLLNANRIIDKLKNISNN